MTLMMDDDYATDYFDECNEDDDDGDRDYDSL